VPNEALAYRSLEELPEIARSLLADPGRRRAIRAAARARALRDHSWEARWRTLFAWMRERRSEPRRAAA
jgi:spore maturation protein CgeB